jgi:hypothetical protein
MLSCGTVLVLGGFQVMTECDPGMMRGLLVIARFMMLGGLAMMFGSMFIMLRRLFVTLVNLEFCHSVLLAISRLQKRAHCAGSQLTRQIVYELIGRRAVCGTLSTRFDAAALWSRTFCFWEKSRVKVPKQVVYNKLSRA